MDAKLGPKSFESMALRVSAHPVEHCQLWVHVGSDPDCVSHNRRLPVSISAN